MSVILQQPPRTDAWREVKHWRQNVYDMLLHMERLDDTITTPGPMVVGGDLSLGGNDIVNVNDIDMSGTLYVDTILEHTFDFGVGIEGVIMKDFNIEMGEDAWIGRAFDAERIIFDGSGDRFRFMVGDIQVEKVDPEIRLIDTGNSEYTRVTKADTNNVAARYNRVTGTTTALSFEGNAVHEVTFVDFTFGEVMDAVGCSYGGWLRMENIGGSTAPRVVVRADTVPLTFIGLGYTWSVGDAKFRIESQMRSDADAQVLSVVTGFVWDADTWYHVFTTISLAGDLTLYVDGAYIDNDNSGSVAGGTYDQPIEIGTFRAGTAWPNMMLDEWRFYSGELSAATVLAIYNARSYNDNQTDLYAGFHFYNDLTDYIGTNDGIATTETYAAGIVPDIGEVTVWDSRDGIDAGEEGIITFGHDEGRTVLQGQSIRMLDDVWVDVMQEYTPNAGILAEGVLLKDTTVTTGTLTVAAGSITDTSGTIDFGNEILKTTGVMQAGDFAKTGWPVTPGVTLSFDNANLRLTVTDGGAAYYYIDGVKYVLGGNKTVDITDTEGLWYFYFVGSTLTASQVVWDFTAEDKTLVAFVYWDATNNKEITLGYELHNFIMDGATHGRMHFGGGSAWDTGGLVSDAGAEDVNVETGIILDEDITITITDGVGGGLWEQVLSPAELPIYYRDGASTWRIYETADKANATDAGYVDGANDLHYNKLNGVWASTAAGVGKYVAYFVIESNDQTEPVALIMGQRIDTTLAAAKANNVWQGLSLAGLPFEEMVILARLIVKQTAGGIFYTLEDIVDLRAFNAEGNVTSPLITSHAGLSQLNWSVSGHYFDATVDFNAQDAVNIASLGVGTLTPDRAVEILDAANPQLRLTQADAAQYVDFQVDSGASLIITSIANQIMKIDVTPLHNIAIGKDAGTNFTTGSFNVAVGRGTMLADTEGSNNTAIGALCFITNTTGYQNCALGVSSLYGNTTGYSNVALGVSALYTNTIGRENTSVGVASLYFNTEGNSNLALGFEALSRNTTASNNTAVGTNALRSNTIGTVNSAFGLNALYANIDGDYNVGIGTNALRLNTAGNLNVALGYAAGYYETGSNKLFIDNALRTNEADGRVKALVYGIFSAATANQYLTVNGTIIARENVEILEGGEVRFWDVGSSHYVGFEAPALTASQIWILPTVDGAANEALITNGAGTLSWAAGGGGFTWIQKAAAYTAADLDGILLDSTGGIFTITLPLNPVGGESIAFVDAGSAGGTNNITIARNGESIQGNAGDLIIDFDDAAFVLVFDATYGWRLDPFFATGSPTFLSDADGDTLVQVEQGADDDTIRFTAGGVAVATMVATAIQFGQDVGIGVAPSYPLEIAAGTTNLIGAYVLNGYTGGAAAWGIHGECNGSQGFANAGVLGEASNAGAGDGYGVYGIGKTNGFRDSFGNNSDAFAWNDASLRIRKAGIRDITEVDIQKVIQDVEGAPFKRYRMRETVSVNRETLEPELGDPIGPEVMGLIADDEATPASLVSPSRQGVSGSRLAITALVYAREKIKSLEARVAYLESN